MPVSIRQSPFNNTPPSTAESKPKNKPPKRAATVVGLREPQVRVLMVMMPSDPTVPEFNWPLYTRATMRKVCGFSPTNSMNRILHGVKDGPGKHPGLVEAGLVKEIILDIDGVMEANYHITQEGVKLCLCLRNGDGHK